MEPLELVAAEKLLMVNMSHMQNTLWSLLTNMICSRIAAGEAGAYFEPVRQTGFKGGSTAQTTLRELNK